MMLELTQEFYFEAAHTLDRKLDTDSSRRIHGHTYYVEITIRGLADEATGMVMDLGEFRAIASGCRDLLDHRFLDDVPGLGIPTIENLCRYIARHLQPQLPSLHGVLVARRASGDSCRLTVS